MLPRNTADYRTLLWTLMPVVMIAVQYARPELIPYLWWVTCYFALACGVIAHNHNHCPTFRGRGMNQAFGNWISVFYGYPTFAWIPTHNLNHHKYLNTEGDATITWRYTNKHTFLVALTYFFVSAYYQSFPTNAFLKKTKANNPAFYGRILGQYAYWAGAYVVLFGIAVWLHGWGQGFFVFLMTVAVPAFFALWTIMLFNYEQHVHTDPWSEHDHSRSFESKLLNFLLFNNGYHAAHHENPGMHWSKLGEEHAKIAPSIHPSLKQQSFWWYLVRQYALTPLFPKLGSVQLGRGPNNRPAGAKIMTTADVELGEAGSNASFVGVATP